MTLYYAIKNTRKRIVERGRTKEGDNSVIALLDTMHVEYIMGSEEKEKRKCNKSRLWGWTNEFTILSLSGGARLKRTSPTRGYPNEEIVLPRKGARAEFVYNENKYEAVFSQGRPIRK